MKIFIIPFTFDLSHEHSRATGDVQKACPRGGGGFAQSCSELIEGKAEGYHEEFQGGEDGRVLADNRFLEHVSPGAQGYLAAIIHFICDEYDVREDGLRGPAQTQVLSNARGMNDWLVTLTFRDGGNEGGGELL